MMTRRAPCHLPRIATVAFVYAALPPVAGANEATLDRLLRPSPVAAHETYAAWSRYDPARGRYRLILSDGLTQRVLRVRGRAVPFDADLGPDSRGRLNVVYSRCRGESRQLSEVHPFPARAAGRDCRLFRFDVQSGQERSVDAANRPTGSEFFPSLSGTRLTYARAVGRFPYAAIHVVALTRRERRLDAELSQRPRPVSLEGIDTRGTRTLLSWMRRSGGDAPISELWLLRGARSHLVERRSGDPLAEDQLVSPALPAAGGLAYLRLLRGRDTTGSQLVRADSGGDAQTRAAAPASAVSVADTGTAIYYSTALGADPTTACDVGGQPPDARRSACEIRRVAPPDFR